MRFFILLAAIPSVALGIAACTGEDPIFSPDNEDGSTDGAASSDSPSGDATSDSLDDTSSDAPAACSTKPFTKPVRLSDVSSGTADDFPRFTLSRDELFLGRVVQGIGNFDASVGIAGGVVRYARTDGGPWGAAATMAFNDIGDGGKMNASAFSMTEDSKNAFLIGRDQYNFFVGIRKVTRLGPNQPWSYPAPVTLKDPGGAAAQPFSLFVNADGTRLYYSASSGGKELIFQANFAAGVYGPARVLGFDAIDRSPVLSHDELRIFFSTARPHPGGSMGTLVYTATRTGIDGDFGPIDFVAELNDGADEMNPTWLSGDGCTMLLAGRLTGESTTDVFIATRQ